MNADQIKASTVKKTGFRILVFAGVNLRLSAVPIEFVFDVIRRASAVSCFVLLAGAAGAQGYPTKPIRMIVPFAPAGVADLVARAIGQKLTDAWGQQIVVDNRGGAGGNIGMEVAARSAPDGYTLALGNLGTLGINPSLYRRIPFDSVNDFAPITLVAGTPLLIVVHPSVPAKSAKELIAVAKARPGQLNFGSAGTGGPTHLAGEILKTMAGIDIVHVPYRGNIASLNALAMGEVQIMITNLLTPLPLIKAGRLRALAVTSIRRQPAMPEIPTVAETALPGYNVSGWYGVLAPAGTPKAIVTKLNTEIVKIMEIPELRTQFVEQGIEIFTSTPEAFAAHIRSEREKWGEVVRKSGARAD